MEFKVTGRTLPISEATKARNPEIFRPHTSPGVHSEKPQPNRRREGEDRGVEAAKESTVIRVTYIVRRPRLLDSHDNQRAALKPISDFITTGLGIKSDDSH